MEVISDKALLQKVSQRLSRMGGAQGHVNATVRNGDVTLTGTLQYEIHRQPIVKATSSVGGVRRVIDQLQIEQKKKTW